MHISSENLSPTQIKLTVTAHSNDLSRYKDSVLKNLSKEMNLPGFRKGHAPLPIVEKNVDSNTLQTNFLDLAVSELYSQAARKENFRPVATPDIKLQKFVPFEELEFTAVVDIIGKSKLADYTSFKIPLTASKTSSKDIDAVIEDLRARDAVKEPVEKAVEEGDEATIDFVGTDFQTKEPIPGGSATDYALIIGSNTFIPGFELEILGLKAGDKKSFAVTFPKDYGAVEMQSKKVQFEVTLKKVQKVTKPKLDNEFAAKVGPFTTVDELKADIKKQLQFERDTQAVRQQENEILERLVAGSEIAIPKKLIDEEILRMEEEEKRNLVYRGQTWQEHLSSENRTEEEHREANRPQAEMRVKSGLLLADVAEKEQIDVTSEELRNKITELKQQYTDPQMQQELDNPSNHREIASRILTEKTLQKMREYAG